MNVLCLGGRVVGIELAKELVAAFLAANYKMAVPYSRRVEQVKEIEKRFFKEH